MVYRFLTEIDRWIADVNSEGPKESRSVGVPKSRADQKRFQPTACSKMRGELQTEIFGGCHEFSGPLEPPRGRIFECGSTNFELECEKCRNTSEIGQFWAKLDLRPEELGQFRSEVCARSSGGALLRFWKGRASARLRSVVLQLAG